MVDSIDKETERRNAEIVGAFSMPAASYFSPTAPIIQGKSDTISKASSTSISTTHGRARSIPVLDMPKDAGSEVVIEGLKGMEQLLPFDHGAIDDSIHELFLSSQETFSKTLVATRDYFKAVRFESEAVDKERIDEMQKQIAMSKKVGTWDSVEKALVSFGLIAAGIAGITMGIPLLGIAAAAVGTLMVVDQLLDDKAKKAVAGWLAKGDTEAQEMWVNRIHFFCAATSMALSFGLAAPVAVQYGMHVTTKFGAKLALSVAQGAASGVKSVYEWMNSNQKALLMELDVVCTLAQKNLNRLITGIQQMVDTISKLYENMHRIEDNRDKLSRQMLRLHGS